jgi:hypothetical protein
VIKNIVNRECSEVRWKIVSCTIVENSDGSTKGYGEGSAVSIPSFDGLVDTGSRMRLAQVHLQSVVRCVRRHVEEAGNPWHCIFSESVLPNQGIFWSVGEIKCLRSPGTFKQPPAWGICLQSRGGWITLDAEAKLFGDDEEDKVQGGRRGFYGRRRSLARRPHLFFLSYSGSREAVTKVRDATTKRYSKRCRH